MLYTSPALTAAWQDQGFAIIGDVTFESAAYVARYCLKKINGAGAAKLDDDGLRHYELFDPATGEVIELEPEFSVSSLKPGIGADFYRKYKTDFYPSDECVHEGRLMKPPKYYDKLCDLDDSEMLAMLKTTRRELAARSEHNTPDRLTARHKVKLKQMAFFKRKID